MYGQLNPEQARRARDQVRGYVQKSTDPVQPVMVYADLLAAHLVETGEVDHYWLRCYALADRLTTYRAHVARK